jgi:hypothetical protein
MAWSSKTHLKVIKYKVFQNPSLSMWVLVMTVSRTVPHENSTTLHSCTVQHLVDHVCNLNYRLALNTDWLLFLFCRHSGPFYKFYKVIVDQYFL